MTTTFKGIKTAAEYRRGELTKDMLKLVATGVVLGTAAVVAPNTLQLIDYFNPKGRHERTRIWRSIKYLESKRYIDLETDGTDTYVRLTESGRQKLNEDAIWELRIESPRRWDHKWRMVMFDLPGRQGSKRDAFRLKLQDFGFQLYQRSVFIYPHECQKEIATVAQWYGIDEYVRYVVATEINDMRRFAKLFDLI